jgi:membrane fusion protein, multidrug efflux system
MKFIQKIPALRILFLISLLMMEGCTDKGKKGEMGAGKPPGEGKPNPQAMIEKSLIPVRVETVNQQSVQNSYRATALLVANQDVTLALSEGDLIHKIYFGIGDAVEAGDVIAEVTSFTLPVAKRRALLQLENQRRIHGNSKLLYEGKHIPKETFEETRLKLEEAKLNYAEVASQIDRLTVKAPFAGHIARNDLQLGAHRRSYEQPPLRVVATDILKGSIALPVFHHQHIKTGNKFPITARGQRKEAEVVRKSPVVDDSTGTFDIFFVVQNDSQGYFAGERVELELPLGSATERLILPANSVIFEGDKPFVYVSRPPTTEEISADLQRTKEARDMKPGFGGKKPPEAPPEPDGAPENTADHSPEVQAELKTILSEIPRAKKVAVDIEQLVSGQYALRESQTGEAASLKAGSKVIVIGLTQLAEATKLKIITSL